MQKELWSDEELRSWVKENKGTLIGEICSSCTPYPPGKRAAFMAGSPGAGKTENALEMINLISQVYPGTICHIEQDRIKELLPGYAPEIAEHYHGAASLGVEKVYDHILKKGLSFFMDSTLAQYDKAEKNIERALSKGYLVFIYFIYQSPQNAWFFVKRREQVEGRSVPRKDFIQQFLGSRDTVNALKGCFGDSIKLHVLVKNIPVHTLSDEEIRGKKFSSFERFYANVTTVDSCIRERYTDYDEVASCLV